MIKILFLDIDGVLNTYDETGINGISKIQQHCVEQLNSIIDATQCYVVISSAWRYVIHNEYMTMKGFELMLHTHGVSVGVSIIDILPRDEISGSRGDQIRHWISSNRIKSLFRKEVEYSYCIVDDNDFDFMDKNFVKTDGRNGLTKENAETVVNILNKETNNADKPKR